MGIHNAWELKLMRANQRKICIQSRSICLLVEKLKLIVYECSYLQILIFKSHHNMVEVFLAAIFNLNKLYLIRKILLPRQLINLSSLRAA